MYKDYNSFRRDVIINEEILQFLMERSLIYDTLIKNHVISWETVILCNKVYEEQLTRVQWVLDLVISVWVNWTRIS